MIRTTTRKETAEDQAHARECAGRWLEAMGRESERDGVRDYGRVAYMLGCMFLTIHHLCDAEARASLEHRARVLLEAMYERTEEPR